ncbi:putative pnuC protein [Vibrio parahaemolyticus 10296]|nr:putative pnuC protein [Vibrio parahaemolyticus 10296]
MEEKWNIFSTMESTGLQWYLRFLQFGKLEIRTKSGSF